MRRTASDGAFRALLEPAIEGAPEEIAGDVLGRDLEERIDAGLDRPLAQQIAAERVDGADARLLELRQRRVEMRAPPPIAAARASRARSISARSRSFSSPAAFSVKVTRDDAVELRPAGGERRHHAADERRRLAGAGRRLDDSVVVEVGRDAVALGLIGERARALTASPADASSVGEAVARLPLRRAPPRTDRTPAGSRSSGSARSTGAAGRKPVGERALDDRRPRRARAARLRSSSATTRCS